jgi:hypothetical protein
MHFSIFNLKFSNTYKNQEKYDKKTGSNFKLCGEDIIPKNRSFDSSIQFYSNFQPNEFQLSYSS